MRRATLLISRSILWIHQRSIKTAHRSVCARSSRQVPPGKTQMHRAKHSFAYKMQEASKNKVGVLLVLLQGGANLCSLQAGVGHLQGNKSECQEAQQNSWSEALTPLDKVVRNFSKADSSDAGPCNLTRLKIKVSND